MIETRELSKRYGQFTAVDAISFKVEPGQVLGFLGPNGAGKSTTMKSIAGILRGGSGSITLNGAEIFRRPSHRIARAGLAYVPEDRQIFGELTVEDNLLIATKADPAGQKPWSLERVYEMLPLLKPLRGRLGGQLSGGEQQMLTIGRALMGNPSVILLDEPSEGLAPIMVQKVGELVKTLRDLGSTIVLAEQNLHFCLGLADHAVIIDKGKGVFYGMIAELNANEEIKRRYLSV